MNFKKGISIGLALSLVLGSSMTALASPNELVKSLGESKEKVWFYRLRCNKTQSLNN